ncbi:MAG: PD40 domain-containing protein [Chloroflexi bacterium]|nr:PD40 domain-containing protein [Chloroflexota bacterium]
MFAKRAFLWLALLAVITFSIWGVSPRLEAQSELDEVLPERLEMLVYPPTEENSAELAAVLAQMAPPDTAATTAPPNFHLPATLLVYQNFDTGNWEVLLNTAAQAKINLSNHPAADIHPRLNRGATHVLFASNRAGNFDLYVMKVDGSNLTQLTASAGDDVNPVWSPDGSKIAFESYRDGQPEIYVMNADGSNQTRLTNDPDFDGMPTWSPDGQTIAFSSRRTGGYRIYTMDATTGANQIQRSTHPYSLSPSWSPDGKLIAFTADPDNEALAGRSIFICSK